MLMLYGFGMLFARLRAKRLGVDDGEEALGFGDVTISCVLGLMLGFPNIFYGLITGILIAGAFSILLILTLLLRKKFESTGIYIAYGPFLVLGAAFYLFFR
jgi:leader peptidase (prepilin peptidase)/N-methyltransferase